MNQQMTVFNTSGRFEKVIRHNCLVAAITMAKFVYVSIFNTSFATHLYAMSNASRHVSLARMIINTKMTTNHGHSKRCGRDVYYSSMTQNNAYMCGTTYLTLNSGYSRRTLPTTNWRRVEPTYSMLFRRPHCDACNHNRHEDIGVDMSK